MIGATSTKHHQQNRQQLAPSKPPYILALDTALGRNRTARTVRTNIAVALYLALDKLEIAPTQPISVGAMLSSKILQEIIVGTLNAPLYPLLEREASARGSALLALEALGIIHDRAHVPVELEVPVLPDDTLHAI